MTWILKYGITWIMVLYGVEEVRHDPVPGVRCPVTSADNVGNIFCWCMSGDARRKRADMQTLSAEISLDCGNFQLAAVNLLYKAGNVGKFES